MAFAMKMSILLSAFLIETPIFKSNHVLVGYTWWSNKRFVL